MSHALAVVIKNIKSAAVSFCMHKKKQGFLALSLFLQQHI
jgi:hypothetical protein